MFLSPTQKCCALVHVMYMDHKRENYFEQFLSVKDENIPKEGPQHLPVLTITFLQCSDTMSGQYVSCTATAKIDLSIKNLKYLNFEF